MSKTSIKPVHIFSGELGGNQNVANVNTIITAIRQISNSLRLPND